MSLVRIFKRTVFMPTRLAIRKDPEQILTMPTGVRYGLTESNLKHVKLFLSDKYAIPDELALQVITHKSFTHGIKPYNEKLSAMGSKLLNLFLAKFVVDASTKNEMAVNGKNLDVLGTPIAKELGGRMALGLFAKAANLNTTMFWRSYNSLLSFQESGELKVSAQMMYALVGAVTFIHGKKVAEAFVKEKLLEGPNSLESIASKFLEQDQA